LRASHDVICLFNYYLLISFQFIMKALFKYISQVYIIDVYNKQNLFRWAAKGIFFGGSDSN